MRGDGVETDRVAIGRGLGDGIGADVAARTAPVLDDELLAAQLGKRLADDTRQRVGRPAGGKGIDVAHCPVGPVVSRAGDA